MGRNVARKMQQQGGAPVAASPTDGLDTPPMKGGTPGVNTAKLQAVPSAMQGQGRRTAEPTRSRKFEVVGGPSPVPGGYMVHYPNQGKVRLAHGKTIDESSCDVEHLRKQGVKLQEIMPPPPPPEPEPEEEAKAAEEVEDETTDED